MLIGTGDPAVLGSAAPPLGELRPADFPHVDVVQVAWELAGVDPSALLPPALHPTLPTMITLTAVTGPVGGLGLLRLSCRHGARARALLIGAVAWGSAVDRAAAFGCGARAGEVRVHVDHLTVVGDGIDVMVRLDGERALGGDDVQYVTGLHPVVAPERGLRLLQVELQANTGPVRGHRPVAERFDWAALAPGLRPAHPIAATVAHGSLHLPQPRFAARPDVVAHLGSERL